MPPGGQVASQSGTYTCETGETCIIEVQDAFFDETFVANPDPGFEFIQWRIKDKSLCGGQQSPCKLSTLEFPGTPATQILESDEVFFLHPVFGKPGTWKQQAQMKAPRAEFSGCTIGGKLYVIGGRTGSVSFNPSFINTVEEYDPEKNQWKVISQVPTERKHTTAVAAKGKCFVIGGQSSAFGTSGPAIATVEAYDPENNTWKAVTELPANRVAAVTLTVDGKFYVVGGASDESSESLASTLEYTP